MKRLLAEDLRDDPRIQEAKQLINNALTEHQQSLTSVCPPDPDRAVESERLVERLKHARGAGTFYPYLGSGIGHGPLVELIDGSVKYDFICGIGVHFMGHSHPKLVELGVDAALADTVMQGHLQQNRDTLTLSEQLIDASGLDHCFLTSSGAMANENALKMAFHRHQPATRILAFENCFMGRTLALSQVTDKPQYRQGLPLNVGVDYVPFHDRTAPEESEERAVSTLRRYIQRYPGQHAAMVFELVQGEGGFFPGTTSFFRALMEECKKHDIAVFVDEVQTFGRTLELFAYQHFQLDDYVDLVSIGKLSQVCATLYRSRYQPKPGLLSQTFTSSTSAIRAATAILQHVRQPGFYGKEGKVAHLHQHFARRLQEIEDKHPTLLQGPFGIGAMVAFTPFEGDSDKVARFVQDLFAAGVISFIAGGAQKRVRFLVPAAVASEEDIEEVCKIVEATLLQTVERPQSAHPSN